MEASGSVSGNDPLTNFSSALRISSREYIYSPVQGNQIRLLRGRVGKHGALIGYLETFSLGPELPAFRALSYTWGASAYTNSIDIGGNKLPVLDSLYPFLRYLLDEDSQGSRTWWWIDSICINQKDENEKGSQVRMMGQIFRTAEQTLVWLGEEGDGSTQAIKFLWFIEKTFKVNKKPSAEWLTKVVPRDGVYGKDWEALEKLFCRPWWTRVWTVQEYVVSRELIIYCGEASIPQSIFRRALLGIWQCHGKTLKYDGPWNRNRVLEWHLRFGEDEDTRSLRLSLTATMAYLGYHQATDPRDRIYSLSGIVKDFDLAGVPDYNQPVELLYSKLVQSFVERYRSLDIICFTTLFRSNEAASKRTLPSWVPDWRVRATAMVGPLMASQSGRGWIGNLRPLHALHATAIYCASLTLEPKVAFKDLRELSCQGFILDSIDGLAGLPTIRSINFPRQSDDLVQPTSHRFSSSSQLNLTSREASSIMESIMRCLTLNRGDHYFNHCIPAYEYSQQFRTLLDMAGASNPALKFSFRAWFTANRSFHICGCDLETLTAKWLESGETIRRDLPRTDDRSAFYSRFHDTLVKMSRRLVVTHDGVMGMAPSQTRKNDLICVLYGLSVPVVLRECEDGETYTFVGECYADGFMNGQAITMAKDLHKKLFRIV